MLDLTKKVLPAAVAVDGEYFPIRTDFRAWLRFIQILQDSEAQIGDIEWLFRDRTPADKKKALDALVSFAYPKNPLPRGGQTDGTPILDYTIDSDLIYSAFREQYGIDLIKEDMHWHVFTALLAGLHGTKLNDVMGFRSFDENDRTKYEESMRQLREAWTLAGLHRTEEEADAEGKFNEAFGEGEAD